MNNQSSQFSYMDALINLLKNGAKINENQGAEIAPQQTNTGTPLQQKEQTAPQAFGTAPNSPYNPMKGQSQVKSMGEKFSGILGSFMKGGAQ